MDTLNTISIAFVITLVGALPFGLVNLKVLNQSLIIGTKSAMRIAHGAALVEVIYGIIAILIGSVVAEFIQNNSLVKISLLIFIATMALFFFFKNENIIYNSSIKIPVLLQGVLLNLLSVQVFMFWIIALLFVYSQDLVNTESNFILPFLIGIWIGKMGVLWMYSTLGHKLISKKNFISKYINRIIGSVLLVSVIIQWIKY